VRLPLQALLLPLLPPVALLLLPLLLLPPLLSARRPGGSGILRTPLLPSDPCATSS
jgi:hypothetical protein